MALLIVEHHGTRRMAPLARRILIGRRTGNHVVINDRAVSMIHAWIDKRGEECLLTDTGSRTGTFVNGKRIARPLPLVDGDVITVGPATLTFDAHGGAEPQDDARVQDAPVHTIPVEDPAPPSPAPPAEPIPPAGIPAPVASPPPPPLAPGRVELTADGWLFDCACGAPLWAGASFSGRTAYCRYCGREVRVPDAATMATVAEEPAQARLDGAAPRLAETAEPLADVSPPTGPEPAVEPVRADEAPVEQLPAAPVATVEPAPAIRESPPEPPAVVPPSPAVETDVGEPAAATVETVFIGEPAATTELATKAFEPTGESLGGLSPAEGQAPSAESAFSSELSEAIARALESSAASGPAKTDAPDTPAPVQAPVPAMEPAAAGVPPLPAPVTEPVLVTPPVATIAPEAVPLASTVAATVPVIEAKPDVAPQPAPVARHAGPPPAAVSLAPSETSPVSSPVIAAPLPARPSASPTAAAQNRAAPTPPAKAKFTLKATRTCGICQSGILFNEKTTTCPSCGLTFHAECWVENRGCAAYGCPQVGILDAKKPAETGVGADAAGDDDAAVAAEAAAVEREAAKAYAVKAPFPWEYATLAGSAFCVILSAFTFGVPSLLVGAGTMIYLSKKPGVRRKTGVLLLSTLIALVGCIVGLMVSWFLYFDRAGGGIRR